MLPVGSLVSGLPPPLVLLVRGRRRVLKFCLFPADKGRECCVVRPAHAPSPITRVQHSGENKSGRRSRGSGASGDRSVGNGGVRSSGCASSRGSPHLGPRSTRRQAGGGGKRWGPDSPQKVGAFTPSPRAAEAAEETVPRAGARAPAARPPTREATRAAEVLARTAETAGGAAAVTPVAATTFAEPPTMCNPITRTSFVPRDHSLPFAHVHSSQVCVFFFFPSLI
jgi:hypothetical protein